jgi:predicted MFS family arabinose efflux permease
MTTSVSRAKAEPLPVGRTALIALIGGGLILTLAMGIRQTFGLLLSPMSVDLGIGREQFALAMAVQNLLWGALQPFTGMLADHFGPLRVLLGGAIVYALGLVVMAAGGSALALHLGGGILIGIALSAVSFAVVLGAVGRLVAPERRSMALGVASAGGSFGQFIMAPVGQILIADLGWAQALGMMAALVLLIAPLALVFARGRQRAATVAPGPHDQRLGGAIRESLSHGGFLYLNLGFFVCGFQVVFIAVHLPAYLADLGVRPAIGAWALALIGLFNILGTWGCGALGGHYLKKYLLSSLYALRAVVIALFLVLPKTELTVLLFASAIGLLWLGTMPLTSGLVAQIFGVRYLGTLFGIVFFSHQVGSFLGAWLGGLVFDLSGSYDPVWVAAIVLGLLAAAIHLPIAEKPLRPVPA